MKSYLNYSGLAVLAHRGGSIESLENTIESFHYSISLGCKFIETDVQVSSDGIPYIFHDEGIIAPPYKKTKNTFNEEPVFTLQTNYLIEPESIFIEQPVDPLNLKKPIKTLIVNEEYFSAAKQIVNLKDSQIFSEFYNMDDFYYWSSYVFYNLDNHEEALRNISMIVNREQDPEMLFLEALILENLGEIKSSESILIQLISQFPNNDYSDYSRNILLEK